MILFKKRKIESSNQIATTSGAHVEGDLTVHGDLSIHVNAQPSTSQASTELKTPFRSNLPIPTPSFKGRAEILRDILNHFAVEPVEMTNCWQRMATIVGIGGIGKSETASTFAHKYRETFPCAAWIDAETEESTLNSFLKLAKELEIVSRDTQRANLEIVKEVYDHIDAHYLTRVLLIFDNAIQLHSYEENFGIFEYLPTQDLVNQRFPFIIITSQTPDWQKGIKTFKLEDLSEEESIDYFRSSFDVPSSECDEAFQKLHSLLQGYPLAMNLSASNIDYDDTKDTLRWLQEQIELYIEKFEKEDSRILTEKMSKNSPSKYDKTLATVWQLSFQRMRAEPDGENAHVLLQALSFFHGPVYLHHLRFVFIECHFCPGTPDWMKFEYLRDSIRLLQRSHILDCDFQEKDYSLKLQALQSNEENNVEELSRKFKEQVKSSKEFWCELRVHRLIQLVVRLQMECGPVLEEILRYLAFWTEQLYVRELNVAAVEEAIRRTKLTTRALAFVGLLALRNNPSAKMIVRTLSPPAEGRAATIWSVHGLNKDSPTLNVEAVDVLRRFVKLGTSEESLVDKRCFADMALQMFNSKKLFPCLFDDGASHAFIFLPCLTGMEDIACELLATGCSFTDVCSLPLLCDNLKRGYAATRTLELGKRILEHLNVARLPNYNVPELAQMLQQYREILDRGTDKFHQYREEVMNILTSKDSWDRFESDVKSCGSDQVKLKQVFSSILHRLCLATCNKNFIITTGLNHAFRGIDLLVWRFLIHARDVDILIPLLEAFIEIVVHEERELLNNMQSGRSNGGAMIWICSTWMNISIQEDLMGLEILFRHLSRVPILAEIKKMSFDRISNVVQSFFYWGTLQDTHEMTYQRFMKNYSESSVEEIRTLVAICGDFQREMRRAYKQHGLPVIATPPECDDLETRHPFIKCDGCSEEGIMGRRFKCSTCDDYDLCQSCFAGKNIHAEHAHVFLVLPSPIASYALDKNDKRRRVSFDVLGTSKCEFLREFISSEVTCKGCSEGITGLRFICTECQDYDLCQECHIGRNLHSHHMFVSTQSPYVAVLSWTSAMFLAMRVLKTRDRFQWKF